MLEWSDVDVAVRDAVREFVDKEVRPHIDALESGDMEYMELEPDFAGGVIRGA